MPPLPDNQCGFYFFFKDKIDILESMLCQFYTEVIEQLGMLDRQKLIIDGKEQILTEELMQSVINAGKITIPKEKLSSELLLFRGSYLKLFEDGSILQKFMYNIFAELGDSKIIWVRWKAKYGLQNKSNPKLRAFYRYIDECFLAQLPTDQYMAVTTDSLLYCDWKCAHPNLIGFHMVFLTWMLDVKEFKQFIPSVLKNSAPLTDPLLKLYWPASGLRIQLAQPAVNRVEDASK